MALSREEVLAAKRGWYHKNKDRLRERARANYPSKKLKQKEYRLANPDKYKRLYKYSKLLAAYGLSESDYENLWVVQDNKCAICSKVLLRDRTTHVDHCHVTGLVRGLLCSGCNSGLGYFDDNADFLQSAIRYLEVAKLGVQSSVNRRSLPDGSKDGSGEAGIKADRSVGSNHEEG